MLAPARALFRPRGGVHPSRRWIWRAAAGTKVSSGRPCIAPTLVLRVTRCRLLKAAADEFSTPAPPPVPTGIEFASSDDDADEPPPPPPLFPADFFSPSGSGGSPDFLQQTPPPPMPLPPLPPPLDVSALARELQVQGLSEEEQIAIAMEER